MTVSGYTQNYRLRKFTFDTRGWHLDEWYNLDTIDGLLAAGIDSGIAFVGVPGGTGNAITLDFTPNITYTSGQLISFIVGAVNTGAVTVNCDGLGAKSLKTAGGAALVANQLQAGMYVRAIYDGTNFVLIYPAYTATTTPYVSSGSSGAVADPSANDFYVENSADVGISLLNPANYVGRLYFGRPLSPSAGGIKYDHVTDSFTLRLAATDKIAIDSAGVVDLGGTGYVKNTLVPGFSTQRAVSGAATLPTANVPWIIGTELFDHGGCYNAATGVFTAPVAGIYRFRVEAQIVITSGSVITTISFYKNGAAVGFTRTVTSSTSVNGNDTNLELLINLAAGDTIDFRCGSLSSAVTSMGGSFSGYLVG